MIERLHDGKKDRATNFAVTKFDFDDLNELELTAPEAYNTNRMAYAKTDNVANRLYDCGEEFFAGLRTGEQIRKLVDNGWEEGAVRGSDVSLSLEGTLEAAEAIRRRAKWGEDGEEMCADRALRGDWDTSFVSMPRLRTSGSKIVTLYGSVGGEWFRKPDELFWNGIQLVVLSDMLESAGYQTEVYGINICEHYNGADKDKTGFGMLACRAKVAGEPLRVDTMASVFAHAAVFRTYFFQAMALLHMKVDSGFGSPKMGTANMIGMLGDAAKHGWLPPSDAVVGMAYTKETAVANIIATLRALTGQGVAA